MRSDKYGNPIFEESDIFDLIYQEVPIDKLSSIIVSEDIEDFKKHSEIPFLTKPNQDIDINQIDKLNQANWFMGDYYKEMDIAKWLIERCTTQEELDRVGEELILFVQYDMINILRYLKYLVDIMRYHNIVWGVGRGSSVASYCLYLIGVHKINSIKYKLDFKEFLR